MFGLGGSLPAVVNVCLCVCVCERACLCLGYYLHSARLDASRQLTDQQGVMRKGEKSNGRRRKEGVRMLEGQRRNRAQLVFN